MPAAAIEPRVPDSREMPGPRVHVLDDDVHLCDSLRFLLESDGLAVETYSQSDEFLAALDPTAPGCVLLDLKLHEESGLDVLRKLSALRSRVPVIMFSGHGVLRDAVNALQLGAIDFLEKPVENHLLLSRIHEAIERSVTAWPLQQDVERIRSRRDTLTARQNEVLDLVVAGLSSKEIAERLTIKEKTVEAHRASISEKMRSLNVSDLVRMVLVADPPESMRAG